jgi:hypothetical protein
VEVCTFYPSFPWAPVNDDELEDAEEALLKHWHNDTTIAELDPHGVLLMQRLNSDYSISQTYVATMNGDKIEKCWTIFGQRAELDTQLLELIKTEPAIYPHNDLDKFNAIFTKLI